MLNLNVYTPVSLSLPHVASIQDCIETDRLLSPDNVDQEALLSYAREAADFGTNYQLPSLDYAINHYGQPDVAMFDFTCMYASENAALIREKRGHQLVVALVGDSLLEVYELRIVGVFPALFYCTPIKAHVVCIHICVHSLFGRWVQAVPEVFWLPSILLGW